MIGRVLCHGASLWPLLPQKQGSCNKCKPRLILAHSFCLTCMTINSETSFFHFFIGNSSNIKYKKFLHMPYTSNRLPISGNLRQKLIIDSIWNGIHKIYSTNHSYNICLLMYTVKERSLFAHALLTT